MEISTVAVKELRQRTGAGVMDCKKALLKCAGNIDEAIDFLRNRGLPRQRRRRGGRLQRVS